MSTIQFTHVFRYSHDNSTNEKYLIAVTFDGEPELWLTDNLEEAKKELVQYYWNDWKGTNRRLPCEVFTRSDYCEFDLRKTTPTITTKAQVLEEGRQIIAKANAEIDAQKPKPAKKTKAQSKLETLAEIEGFKDPTDMLQEAMTDSICPGICINKDCDYTTEVEPDSREGWCEECNTNTVQSAMVLAGVI